MNKERDIYLKDELFQKWVSSNDESVNEYWENYLKEHPENVNEIMESREFLRSIKFKNYQPRKETVEYSWTKLQDKIDTKQVIWKTVYKYAAVVMFFVLAWLAVNFLIENGKSLTKEIRVSSVHKQAEKGIKLTVQLSDGTKIKLNSGSQLIYPERFSSETREVELIGEGYFDVAHDSERPFIVKSGDVRTKVLGTVFSINAFDENQIQVALVSGSVMVDDGNKQNNATHCDSLILEPGFKAIYKDDCFTKAKINKIQDLGWKDDIIVFNNNNFNEIVTRLENWYGVDFEVENEQMISKSFNGVYEKEVLDNVLHSISYAMNFTYQIKGNKVFIKGH